MSRETLGGFLEELAFETIWEDEGVDFRVDTQCCLIEKILAEGESLQFFPFMRKWLGFLRVSEISGLIFLFSPL